MQYLIDALQWLLPNEQDYLTTRILFYLAVGAIGILCAVSLMAVIVWLGNGGR